ncbi:MAG: hypothetical protein ACOVMP_05975 [Chthoniobacterales bacterium]
MAFPLSEALQRLNASIDAGRLAHAYLICGPVGSGKKTLIDALCARLLNTTGDALTKHADFHTVAPESKSRRILVEQMRTLEHAMRERAIAGRRKVAVIQDADRMQPQAANAFLKTLEEPPSGSHFFLVSSLPGALMDTIISRCLPIHLVGDGAHAESESDRELEAALDDLLDSQASPETAGLQFARVFLDVLGRERDQIRAGFQEGFKSEQAHYKQSTDGKWLEDREDQLKASAEAAVVQKRGELLQIVHRHLAGRLRATATTTLSPEHNAGARAWLRCTDALDALAADLQRGVYESLAIEAGFLNLFQNRP